MAASDDDLKQRIHTGRESLDTELKPWQDPSAEWGKAIIAKGCMALRNNNGGFLIIGMQNDGSCDNSPKVADIRTAYHHDEIQAIITKYSTDPFEIVVHFVEREGLERVVIEVPSGFRTPAIARNYIPKNDNDKGEKKGSLLAEGQVYVRTLSANGIPSSSVAKPPDWPRLMEFCFNNREADIGAFMRRQLSGIDINSASAALFDVLRIAKGPTPAEVVKVFMDDCWARYTKLRNAHEPNPPKPGTREMGAVISGDFPEPVISQEYLFRLAQIHRYSGWSPFYDALNPNSGRPRYIDNGVESFLYAPTLFNLLEFSRIESLGRFYYCEGLRDDLTANVAPGQHLEFVGETQRVTEIIATVLDISKIFCGTDSTNTITFTFRWRSLTGRHLSTWANPNRNYYSRSTSVQDDFERTVAMPVATVPEAIQPHVEAIMKQLFLLFGGEHFHETVLAQIIKRTLRLIS